MQQLLLRKTLLPLYLGYLKDIYDYIFINLGMSSMYFYNYLPWKRVQYFCIYVMLSAICDQFSWYLWWDISDITATPRCWPGRGRQSCHADDEGEKHDEEEDGHEEWQHVTGTLTLPRHRHVGRQGRPGVRGHSATVLVLLQTLNHLKFIRVMVQGFFWLVKKNQLIFASTNLK